MRGSVFQRKSGRWVAIVDNGYGENGRRKQKWSTSYRTKSEAEASLIDLLGKQARGETIDPDQTPTADYLVSWIDGRVDELAPLSVTQYRSVVRNHVKGSTLGGTPLGKVRRSHIRAHEKELVQKGLAAGTVNVIRAVISKAFSDALEDDLIGVDPTIGKRRATGSREVRRGEPRRFTVWTPEELRELLQAAEADRLAALWRLAVASGARRGELLGSTWLAFSAEKGTLTIGQQVVPTRGGATITPLKTKGSHRTVSLDAVTVAAIEAHRERQLVERDAAGAAYEDRDLIFCDELGRLVNPPRATEAFNTLRAAAGVRAGRLHDVRHSHATILLTGDARRSLPPTPVHIVSARLGHSSPMVTLSVYVHVLPKSDEQAAAVIGGILEAAR